MSGFNMFPSFAPSQDSSPQTIKDSVALKESTTDSSTSIHKFSIHLPQDLLQRDFYQEKQILDQNQSNVQVFCRLRPPNKSLVDSIRYDQTMIDDGQNCYSFDRIFGKYAGQYEVYQGIAKRHIDEFMMGRNSTIFAYGQTGSGKTHTMFGQMKDPEQFGLIPRVLAQIFKKNLLDSTITCSMLEIYNQKIVDLLNPSPQNLQIKIKQYNQNIFLEGLIQVCVQNQDQILNLIKLGHKVRKTASTSTNDMSSRSHTVLFVYRNYKCQDMDMRCKLCFIDLAGSQKVRKSGAQGQTLQEAKKINLSLSCLGNVVNSLTNGSDYIPYRNSKLTRILKDSLTGETKTSIVTTCSLDKGDHSQTLSTIKFAIRAKKIKNKKKISNAEITMEQMLESLKKQLAATKEELNWYKKKEQIQCSLIQDIPQQSIDFQPLRSLTIGPGICNKTKTMIPLKNKGFY